MTAFSKDTTMQFAKYQGTGNDFVMLDNRQGAIRLDRPQIEALCSRRFGIGADGLILLENGPARLRMVYYNSDGRESSMCGNGGRCFARFAKDLGLVPGTSVEFDAVDGRHRADFDGDTVILQMADCKGYSEHDDAYVLDTGSPHYVKFVSADFWDDDLFVHNARLIRNSPAFREKGINVNFICETAPGRLRIRTFERGVEDETYSCGTGVTAAAIVYGHRAGFPDVTLESKGGSLAVSFQNEADGSFSQVLLKGPAKRVFSGEWTF